MDEIGARLFLLDSLATHFRAEYGTDPEAMPERQAKAGKITDALRLMVQLSNGVAIYTNQESVDATGYGKPKQHAMGFLVGHKPAVRIKVQMRNSLPSAREFLIEKVVDLPPRSCLLEITKEGFVEASSSPLKKEKN